MPETVPASAGAAPPNTTTAASALMRAIRAVEAANFSICCITRTFSSPLFRRARPFRHRLPRRRSRRAACQTVHFPNHARGLDFQRPLHLFVIFLREFAGAVLETQVAQIFVNRIAALQQLIELRAMRREIGGFEIGRA